MIQITDKITAFELPEGAENIRVSQLIGRPKLFADLPGVLWAVKLPPGTWRFLFTTKTATEEQAASVVQIISNGKISGRPQYRRYDRDNELPARMWTRDSRHSLETLLRSKGLDPENNFALIEKM